MSYDPFIAPYDDLCSDVLDYRREQAAAKAKQAEIVPLVITPGEVRIEEAAA